MSTENPVNPLPPVVVILTLMIFAVEAVLSLGAQGIIGGPSAVGWRLAAMSDWGYSPLVWEQLAQRGDWSFDIVKRFVTYAFVHVTFTHALFAGALLLALGKFVGDVFHWLAVLAVFVVAAVAGAVVFGLSIDTNLALIGAYPPVYGMIGAFTYIMWMRLGAAGQNQLGAFRLIGFLLALQLVFGLLFGADPTWVADLSGFVAGLALSPLVAPGGWRAFLARVRQR
ncbi:MAG: rhomboid family intramembrane serine protease [Flavimaricola sp.]|nr:rhomboid family intramembrane serine protease [Flavimaricola sp.]